MHPRNDAPRCLPCHFDEASAGVDVSKAPYRANKGCPCTPQLICTLPEFADVFHGGCEVPRHPQRTYSMHGGSGALISVGLLRKVDLSFMERCIQGDVSTGEGGGWCVRVTFSMCEGSVINSSFCMHVSCTTQVVMHLFPFACGRRGMG